MSVFFGRQRRAASGACHRCSVFNWKHSFQHCAPRPPCVCGQNPRSRPHCVGSVGSFPYSGVHLMSTALKQVSSQAFLDSYW